MTSMHADNAPRSDFMSIGYWIYLTRSTTFNFAPLRKTLRRSRVRCRHRLCWASRY